MHRIAYFKVLEDGCAKLLGHIPWQEALPHQMVVAEVHIDGGGQPFAGQVLGDGDRRNVTVRLIKEVRGIELQRHQNGCQVRRRGSPCRQLSCYMWR
jgi:hypothetical protein